MEKTTFKNALALIAYTILLLMACLNIDKVFGGIAQFLGIISPFFIAICIAFIVNLPMKKIEPALSKKLKKSTRRAIAITLAFSCIILVFTTILLFLIPQLSQSVKSLSDIVPTQISNAENYLYTLADDLNIPDSMWDYLMSQVNSLLEFFGEFIFMAFPKMLDVTVNIANSTINFFIGLVVSVYILNSKESLIRNLHKLIKAIFPSKTANYLEHVGQVANKTFTSFIAGQLTESFILGSLCTIGLFILRIDYAVLIGVIVGVSSLIPIFGSILGTIPCLLLLLVVSPQKALIFLVFIFILQQLEGDLIYPRVVGKSIGISGLWVMFAMIVGGSLIGVFGLIIGIPIFAVFYALTQEWVEKRLKEKGEQIEKAD